MNRGRRLRDRGSTLFFFPAVLLVVVVLASLTVDLGRIHLAQREVDDLAAGAANDAVTVALDVEHLRRTGAYRLRTRDIAGVVAARRVARSPAGLQGLRATGRALSPTAVEVAVGARVPLSFARVLPSAPRSVPVQARAEARARLR